MPHAPHGSLRTAAGSLLPLCRGRLISFPKRLSRLFACLVLSNRVALNPVWIRTHTATWTGTEAGVVPGVPQKYRLYLRKMNNVPPGARGSKPQMPGLVATPPQEHLQHQAAARAANTAQPDTDAAIAATVQLGMPSIGSGGAPFQAQSMAMQQVHPFGCALCGRRRLPERRCHSPLMCGL